MYRPGQLDRPLLGGTRIKEENCPNIAGANALVLSPEVEIAILARHFSTIRAEGLGLVACDVLLLKSHANTLDTPQETAST